MKNLAEKLQATRSVRETTTSQHFSEQQKLSKLKDILLSAREELTEASKTESWAGLKNALMYFAQTYHIISVIFGLATAILAVFLFSGFSFDWEKIHTLEIILRGGIALFAFVLMVFILVLIEQGKIFFSKAYFAKTAKKIKTSNFETLGLISLTFFSVVFSTLGGVLIAYKSTNQTEVLSENYQNQILQTQKQFDERIKNNENKVKDLTNLSTNTNARKWGLTENENQNLAFAQTEIKRLELEKQKNIEKLEVQKSKFLLTNQDYTFQAMLVSFFIVLLFELITVFAYFFKYKYLVTVEREAVALGVSVVEDEFYPKNTQNPSSNPNEGLRMLQELADLLHQNSVPNNPQPNQLNPYKGKDTESNPIGFNYAEATQSDTKNTYQNNQTIIQERIIIKQPPIKEKYDYDKLLSKHTDIVKIVYETLPKKVKYLTIHRKTGKDVKTIRKVYEAMLVKGYLK